MPIDNEYVNLAFLLSAIAFLFLAIYAAIVPLLKHWAKKSPSAFNKLLVERHVISRLLQIIPATAFSSTIPRILDTEGWIYDLCARAANIWYTLLSFAVACSASRIDMIMLDIKAGYGEVIQCIRDNFYSRVPVYSGTSDNIKGILYIKDLLPYLEKGEGFRWQSLIRPAFFVPETRKIDDLLHDFQTGRIHMAIVVDEFGGTSGLVTLEDVIEEILGIIYSFRKSLNPFLL